MYYMFAQVSPAGLSPVAHGASTVDGDLLSHTAHVDSLPFFLSLPHSPRGAFPGYLQSKWLALQSLSQHLLLEDSSLRQNVYLVRWCNNSSSFILSRMPTCSTMHTARHAPVTSNIHELPSFFWGLKKMQKSDKLICFFSNNTKQIIVM